jgi:hypothetical protein
MQPQTGYDLEIETACPDAIVCEPRRGRDLMSYDEGLAERLRELFNERTDIVEKKMFGGIAFMLSGNMCCGVIGDTLMARVGPAQYQTALRKPHVREMDFTGKAMKGLVYVSPEGLASDEALRYWIDMCESFARSLPAK